MGEAALNGVPVVCTDVGASFRVVTDPITNKRFSAVVAPNDASSLAKAQINILAMLDEWSEYADDEPGYRPQLPLHPTPEQVEEITRRMYDKTEQRRRLGMMGRSNVLNSFSSDRYLREHEQMLWIGKYKSNSYRTRIRPPPMGRPSWTSKENSNDVRVMTTTLPSSKSRWISKWRARASIQSMTSRLVPSRGSNSSYDEKCFWLDPRFKGNPAFLADMAEAGRDRENTRTSSLTQEMHEMTALSIDTALKFPQPTYDGARSSETSADFEIPKSQSHLSTAFSSVTLQGSPSIKSFTSTYLKPRTD
jgi:hypothetical protein